MMDCVDEGKKELTQGKGTVAQAIKYKTSGNACFERKVCNYFYYSSIMECLSVV